MPNLQSLLVVLSLGLIFQRLESTSSKEAILTVTKSVTLEVPFNVLTSIFTKKTKTPEDIDIDYIHKASWDRTRMKPESLISTSVEKNTGAAVRIFDNDNFRGEGSHSQVLYLREGDECLNLPLDWEHKVGSIDTLGLCVLLWIDEECNGSHQIIRGDAEPFDLISSRVRSGRFRSLQLC